VSFCHLKVFFCYQNGLVFSGKAGTYPSGAPLSLGPYYDRLINIRLGRKILSGKNTLAFCSNVGVENRKLHDTEIGRVS
jgi:hypothetical protein